MEQFWKRVEKSSDCWEWRGYIREKGYGEFKIAGRKFRAHRVAWELCNGKIPKNLFVCHK